jgi:hypothetical protein
VENATQSTGPDSNDWAADKDLAAEAEIHWHPEVSTYAFNLGKNIQRLHSNAGPFYRGAKDVMKDENKM